VQACLSVALESKQRQRNRRDLLSLVGKNSLLAVAAGPDTPSGRNERYDARIASTENAHRIIDLLVGLADICVHGISNVTKKIVFDGDGDKSKMPPIAQLAAIAELVAGEEESDVVERISSMSRQDHQDLVAAERG